MIATCRTWLPLWLAPGLCSAQVSAPPLPSAELPEAPEIAPPTAPSAPNLPRLPSAGAGESSRLPPGYTGPTELVLDHKKRGVLYPRLGALQVVGREDSEGVSHASGGAELQVALGRSWLVAAEAQGLYLLSGSYGLVYESASGGLTTFGAGQFTALVGAGAGIHTHLLDDEQLWSHLTVKVGYLHPFYAGLWGTLDVEKEFAVTRDSYWVSVVAPVAGVLVPVREEREDIAGEIRAFVGLQASVAFIFGGRR